MAQYVYNISHIICCCRVSGRRFSTAVVRSSKLSVDLISSFVKNNDFEFLETGFGKRSRFLQLNFLQNYFMYDGNDHSFAIPVPPGIPSCD